jgi:excisionase family DNA binding protein
MDTNRTAVCNTVATFPVAANPGKTRATAGAGTLAADSVPTILPLLLTIPDTCRVLSVSRATVCRWVADGRLRAVKFGARCVRIRADDVRALAQGVG